MQQQQPQPSPALRDNSQELQGSTLSNLLHFPAKFLIASTLIFVNIFHNIGQQRQLQALIKQLRGEVKVDQKARTELLSYLSMVNSVNTTTYPIMIKEYCKQTQQEEYQIGLLINGDAKWQAVTTKIKQHIKVDPSISLSYFCGGRIINQGNIKDLYKQFQHQDGIMYIQYIRMQSFG